MCTHCWFKYFNNAQKNKNSIKADSIQDACKLFGKKANVCKYFHDIPVHYDPSSPILKSGQII